MRTSTFLLFVLLTSATAVGIVYGLDRFFGIGVCRNPALTSALTHRV